MLQPGDRVRVRGERWRVMHVTAFDACSVAELCGSESSNAGRGVSVLLPFEPVDRIPAVADRPRVVRAAAWRRIARSTLAEATPSWRSLVATARARLVLLPYQLEPAIALVRGLACRLLLADEVGLGKTIQAGVAIAELLARERDARVLIVTPAGLREQWSEELRDRFSIEARVIDAAALARSTIELPSGVNPWAIPRVTITSIDFLKRPDVIRSIEPLVWDLVAFDEAHTLSGRSDRAMAADLVAHRARRVLSITATPHNGDDEAFDRLCNVGRFGPGDRLLIFRRSRAEASLPRNRSTRMHRVRPTPEEAAMHRALEVYAARVNRDAPAHARPAARLAMLVLARRACSSAASLARSVERRMALLAAGPGDDAAQLRLPLDEQYIGEDDEPNEELAAPGLSDMAAERRCLDRILTLARAVRNESKIRALTRLLRRAAEPAIVFTEYRDTLRHLAASLAGDMAMLHGGLTVSDRARQARTFTHGRAQLLLATDAASEGLNLHQRCRLVVNLDVPWTPLRLEQRVGRVDRLGQKRPVHAVTFVARDTPEVNVAATLAVRAAHAERGAPFRASDALDANLRAEAVREAERLTVHRALAITRQAGAQDRDDRCAVTVVGRGRRELCLALRLTFVDASGAVVWTTVAGLFIRCVPPPNRTPDAIRRWLDALLGEQSEVLASAARETHQATLDALRLDLREAVAPALARELAIVERIQRRSGQLAAPLLQPGLFDRRAMRNADAQRELLAEATTRARERARRLERLLDVRTGERHLTFAAAWLA
jgi:superfamily II DNA or RNA helicase